MLDNEKFGFAEKGKQPEKPKEEKKEEKKVEIQPYKAFGRDFSILNPEIIDYYKTRMKMMAIKYKLVGRVNNSGQYKVSDAVRYDLVKMEKEIEENGEDYYKAIALYMRKHFFFNIKITQTEDGKGKASLFLSEYIEDFLGLEYIVSHVADYIDDFDDDFRIKVRKAFNLVDVATKVDDFAVPNLAVVMQDCFDLELVVGGLYDMASQIYLMRLLKALEESGEKGAAILARYRELLAGKDIEINEKFRYSSYKALLDRAIDENGGYENLPLDPKVVESIMKDINGTVKAIDNASGKTNIFEAVMTKPDEKVSAPKKSGGKSAGKSGSGSSGGGSGSKGGGGGSKKPSASTKKDEKGKSGGGASLDWMKDAAKEGDKVINPIREKVKNIKDKRDAAAEQAERDRQMAEQQAQQNQANSGGNGRIVLGGIPGQASSERGEIPDLSEILSQVENENIDSALENNDLFDIGEDNETVTVTEVETNVEAEQITYTDAQGNVLGEEVNISVEQTVTSTTITPSEPAADAENEM